MKLKELVKEYGDREVNQKEIEKLLLPKNNKTIWDLEPGDEYCIIDIDGEIFSYFFDLSNIERGARMIGNMFLTKEEAEFELECRKVYQELKRFSREFILNNENWSIFYDGSFYFSKLITTVLPGLLFESEEQAKLAVKTVGEDRVKKYYLGVKK